jgi:hypothetical protein
MLVTFSNQKKKQRKKEHPTNLVIRSKFKAIPKKKERERTLMMFPNQKKKRKNETLTQSSG